MNMNAKQECVANEVVDEFLPKDLGDEQLKALFWMLEWE